MLTKEQIDELKAWRENYRDTYDAVNQKYIKSKQMMALDAALDQAEQAIDLAAENERLKAKIDAVRGVAYGAEETLMAMDCDNCRTSSTWFDQILAIIKDGDTHGL